MNDYLSNLIARSLDRLEVLQPRPTSLFEPLHSEDMAHQPYLSYSDVTGNKPSFSRQPFDDYVQRPGQTEASKDQPPSRTVQSQNLGQENHSFNTFHTERISHYEQPANVLQETEITTKFIEETEKTEQQLGIESQVVPMQDEVKEDIVRDTPQPSVQVTPSPTVIPLQDIANSANIVVQPHIIGPMECVEHIPNEEPSDTQPALQVTIGRVEVRAISQPVQPKRREIHPHPRPTLSLGEYLNQRKRGER
ncbi:MAG: hypothetical protein JSV84_07455 [Gemmatimonadota bacterium]|nr:MAG: hypothetical protein JSV84_07455 [Gemmatimonadota bacterium]